MGYKANRDERFAQIGEQLFLKMAKLSSNAKVVFSLLLLNINRNTYTWEPTKKTNPFKLAYLDYAHFGISRTSFDRGIIELVINGFIRLTGKQRNKLCKIIMW